MQIFARPGGASRLLLDTRVSVVQHQRLDQVLPHSVILPIQLLILGCFSTALSRPQTGL